MKKIIYGIVVALFCSGCDNFLEEYSQSQTVAKKVSHSMKYCWGTDTYLPKTELIFQRIMPVS